MTFRSGFVTRRAVVGALATTGGLLVRAPAVSATGGDLAASTRRLERGAFDLRPGLVYLNAAHLAPMPRMVRAALAEADAQIDSDPTNVQDERFEQKREALRVRLAASIGAQADEVALVRNSTEANNVVVNGFPLTTTDEVVLWSENHASNNVAWDVRAQRDRFSVRRLALSTNASLPADVVSAFEAALTPRTRLLALTHVSNVSGLRLPVTALCAMARQRGIFVHVDGAQSWGAEPVNVGEIGCDSFSGSAHKWLMGPRESGLLYVRGEQIARIRPGIVGLNWGTTAQTDRIGARKYDCLGQRNDATVSALSAALDFHGALGVSAIHDHNAAFARSIRAYCEQLRLPLASPSHEQLASPIVVLDAPESHRATLVKTFYERHQIAVAAKGGIRIAPHVYNDSSDLDRVFAALRALAPSFRA